MLHELPDLFCEQYDALDVEAFRSHGSSWMNDKGLESISENIAQNALAGDLNATDVSLRLGNPGQNTEAAVRFACLRGLDRALQEIHPATRSGRPSALHQLKRHAETGASLDSGQHGGALLLRQRASPRAAGPEHPRDAFGAVTRVPPDEWAKVEQVILPERALLHPPDITGGLMVACAPVIANPDEMLIEPGERDGVAVYRIGPSNLAQTHRRVADVIAAMRTSGARLGLAPEATLTPELLATWTHELRRTAGQGDRLHWVLAGSGDLDGGPRAVNAAVLLDARSGEVLVRQDKLFRFDMDPDTLALWNLTGLLGDQTVQEDMAPGRKLKIVEGGGLRLAILVCEDADRMMDLGAVLRSCAVSHILMPVFSRPLGKHHWEHDAGDTFASEVGATTLVANSRVLETLTARRPQGRGSAMVVTPEDVQVGNVSDPAHVALFTLNADGTVDNWSPAG